MNNIFVTYYPKNVTINMKAFKLFLRDIYIIYLFLFTFTIIKSQSFETKEGQFNLSIRF